MKARTVLVLLGLSSPAGASTSVEAQVAQIRDIVMSKSSVTAQNITVSVRWLDGASQIVRLDFGSRLDGITKGNIESPAVPMIPTMPSALVTKNQKPWLCTRGCPRWMSAFVQPLHCAERLSCSSQAPLCDEDCDKRVFGNH